MKISGLHISLIVVIVTSLVYSVTSLEKRSITSSSSSLGSNSRTTAAVRPRIRNNGPPRNQEELPYYWMCPEVYCLPLSDTCLISEYIVLEYQYEVQGKGSVNVRCQSCPYCLDIPSTDRRRSANEEEQNNRTCPVNIQCPLLPLPCDLVRQTVALIGDVPCKLCPACYDHTVLTSVQS